MSLVKIFCNFMYSDVYINTIAFNFIQYTCFKYVFQYFVVVSMFYFTGWTFKIEFNIDVFSWAIL